MKFKVLVREIMNDDVKMVKPETTVKEAAQLMKKDRIGSVIIEGDPLGIVTATDIVYKHVASNEGEIMKDIMTNDLICISPNKTIEQAANLMSDKEIEKLPVFENGKMIGIITATDVLRIEPALFEILVEAADMDSHVKENQRLEFMECESCGNYSEDVRDVEGNNVCSECANKN